MEVCAMCKERRRLPFKLQDGSKICFTCFDSPFVQICRVCDQYADLQHIADGMCTGCYEGRLSNGPSV